MHPPCFHERCPARPARRPSPHFPRRRAAPRRRPPCSAPPTRPCPSWILRRGPRAASSWRRWPPRRRPLGRRFGAAGWRSLAVARACLARPPHSRAAASLRLLPPTSPWPSVQVLTLLAWCNAEAGQPEQAASCLQVGDRGQPAGGLMGTAPHRCSELYCLSRPPGSHSPCPHRTQALQQVAGPAAATHFSHSFLTLRVLLQSGRWAVKRLSNVNAGMPLLHAHDRLLWVAGRARSPRRLLHVSLPIGTPPHAFLPCAPFPAGWARRRRSCWRCWPTRRPRPRPAWLGCGPRWRRPAACPWPGAAALQRWPSACALLCPCHCSPSDPLLLPLLMRPACLHPPAPHTLAGTR